MRMRWKNLEVNTVLFLLTNALFFLCGIHTFSRVSMKATVLSMIFAAFISYIILSIFLHFAHKKILDFRNIPKFLAIISGILFLLILNYSLSRVIGFITYNVVSSISYYLFMVAFLITVIFAVYKGFHAITRSAFIYFLTILLLMFVTVIALFPKMDFQSVLPLLDSDFSHILQSMGLYIFICLSPYFYLSFFQIKIQKDTIRSLKRGFVCTQIFLIFYLLITFSILGIHITNLYAYPEVSIFKKVSFLNIIDRMESVFSLSYFLSLFIHFAMTLYGVKEVFLMFFPKEKRVLTLSIICFLIFLINSFYKVSLPIWFGCHFLLLLFFGFTLKSTTHK